MKGVAWRRGANKATGWRHTGVGAGCSTIEVGTQINAICRAGGRLP